MECRRDIWPRRRPEAGVGDAVTLSIDQNSGDAFGGTLHCHYAAKLGMGFSSTRKNRELRVPATTFIINRYPSRSNRRDGFCFTGCAKAEWQNARNAARASAVMETAVGRERPAAQWRWFMRSQLATSSLS